MKTKKGKSKGISMGRKIAVGAKVAALSAATGGAYYLLGPDAKAHQKKANILRDKIKKEVKSGIKTAKSVTTPLYHEIVDVVSENYAKQYKIHEKEIKAFAKKLKSEWKGAK